MHIILLLPLVARCLETIDVYLFVVYRPLYITELYKYGVCCLYDDVCRFLSSAATDKVCASLSNAIFGRLDQVIMDNFDLIIQSHQNCHMDCLPLPCHVGNPNEYGY